ncbi:tim barrel metal-dependent [Fusarium tjaetaba]|uniref:Tim barrel metal-dependent n=1 Tax=Fusarium tjaetaba TaxID=1567544 RepID=A0A8H5R772_9HYPO|nr:tim barrel metal-dependent [Fusarium tjaetaba]KAF5627810.1 tim barrel metal-dependent [Fusarium tjaetaba]
MYGLKRIPTFLAHCLFISQAAARTTSSEVCDLKPDSRMPNGSWDSHLHVLDPVRFPPIPGSYKFGTYTAWDATIEETRLGCSHMVLIQPSVYGNDNTLLIDTLKAFGPDRALGVVVFDIANTSTAQLQEWNDLGVRGVRLNFQSTGDAPQAKELRDMMQRYADAIRPFSWILQIYIAMKDLPGIEPVIPDLGVKVVIDHLGHPDIPKSNITGAALDPQSLTGFDSMLRLLKGNNTWVKVSAVYRLSKAPGPLYTGLDPVILKLFKAAPSRLVYASDWPHTRFEGLDIKPWTSHLLDLTKGNVQLRDQLFRENARELWGGNNTIASSARP